MSGSRINKFVVAISGLVLMSVSITYAASPDLKTPSPVIYLKDNLDEKDNLGWCIDTLGRGFSEQIQAHSCKPQGGDVQFKFDEASGQIQSAEYDGKCVTLSDPDNADVPFGLLDCEAGSASQSFAYDSNTLEFHPADAPNMCIVAGAAGWSAGPFMSRNLELKPCDQVAAGLKQWIIKAN